MTASHLEVLTEEPSMEAFLGAPLRRMLTADVSFKIHPFRGKDQLLKELPKRLWAYARWIPENYRIVVLIDRDSDDCRAVKECLEAEAAKAGLRTKSRTGDAGGQGWQIVNRVAVEELEAWYFGDWEAVRAAYPRVSANIPRQRPYRDPDAVRGGTWEAFERIMKKHGYFKQGLSKIEAARAIAPHIDPARNQSRSFACFRDAIREAVAS